MDTVTLSKLFMLRINDNTLQVPRGFFTTYTLLEQYAPFGGQTGNILDHFGSLKGDHDVTCHRSSSEFNRGLKFNTGGTYSVQLLHLVETGVCYFLFLLI